MIDGLERLTWHIKVFHNATAVKLLADSIYCFMDMTVVALFYFSIKIIVKNHNHSIDERSTKELIDHILPTLLGSLVYVALCFVLLMINEWGISGSMTITGRYICLLLSFLWLYG